MSPGFYYSYSPVGSDAVYYNQCSGGQSKVVAPCVNLAMAKHSG